MPLCIVTHRAQSGRWAKSCIAEASTRIEPPFHLDPRNCIKPGKCHQVQPHRGLRNGRATAIDKSPIFDPRPACSAFRLGMNGKKAAPVGRSRSGAGASCTVSKPTCAPAPVLQNPPSADVCKGDACKGLVAKIWDRRVRITASQPDGPETGSAPRWGR
jgi:hypothetical protein